MVNEAALLGARRSHESIMLQDFEDATDRVVAGPERKSRLMSEHEKQVVAYHEVGHAVLAELLPHTDPLHKTSITQRGMGLGYTMQLPSEDRYLASSSELLDEITMLLGGRVVEDLIFGEATTGAANDLERATDLARRMVTEFGMSEKLGPVALTRKHAPPFLGRDIFEDRNYGDALAGEIDKEVREIIENCRSRARQIISEHKEQIDDIVKVLLEKETLEREQFRALLVGEGAPDPKAARLEEKAAQAQPAPGTAASPQPQPA
jgi:cell division protease FtsH